MPIVASTAFGLGTVEDAVEETRQHLYALHRPDYNLTSGSVASGATSVVLANDTTGITTGSFLSVGSELMLVLTVDHGTNTVTVARAQYGSPDDSHADGALVEVNPRFPTWSILRALYREFQSWGTHIFATSTVTIPANSKGPEDVTGDAYFILDAREDDGTLPRAQVRLHKMSAGWKVRQFTKRSHDVEVTVAVPLDLSTFGMSTTLGDGGVGMPDSALDIGPIGAAWRLTMPREIGRTDMRAQGNSRDAQEVPPGHILQTGAALKRMRDERLQEEGNRLRTVWPYLMGA